MGKIFSLIGCYCFALLQVGFVCKLHWGLALFVNDIATFLLSKVK